MGKDNIKVGDEVFFAGEFYKVAEVAQFPHGKMIGIYDEPPSEHIDYLRPDRVKAVYTCFGCDGNGCDVCDWVGKLVDTP